MDHPKRVKTEQGLPIDFRNNYSFHFFDSSIDRTQKILEVGCGDGKLAGRLAAEGHIVTALDPSLKEADHVSNSGVHCIEGDLDHFDGGPFDAVLFNASLHHVFPLDEALKKTDRLLSPAIGAVAL